ncbi:MAG TPA: LutB/LldF family L-lactate oxidation iron-sulfur protein [Anaerolineae bacterium]|nr:LutB/LldF family L-lactate oxidation iron-sulfur protein [Anaerolineae bacterium]
MTAAPITFYERVTQALHDQPLHRSLDKATTRFTTGRNNALATLPEAEALRDHARRIRAHTIAHLDRYLDQFAESVEKRGGHVHWAATAAEANQIVADVTRQYNVQKVVKSKSMVSEELHLNHTLEQIGVQVVETDLGEYIIQLAGETPSHIIAPVIHKNRQQTADLFREKLNASDDDLADVPNMTALARRILRQDFLTADLGITGVNFAVAETGSMCLVMNEGNGRLTTTAPRVHLAIMGMERIVPTMEDLGVMLQLLARSATGQKLSVYTNIITGPRRHPANGSDQAEADGPDEFHLIIVDNGRSQILGSELAEILYCIRCGACLNACPVYQQIGGHAYGSVYPGPVGSVVTPGLYGVEPWSELPHASSLCGACREVCPVRIDIPRMLLKLRNEAVKAGQTPAWLQRGIGLYRQVVTRPAIYHWGARAGSWVTQAATRTGWINQLPGPLSAWTDSRDFPAFAKKSFTQRWKEERGQ